MEESVQNNTPRQANVKTFEQVWLLKGTFTDREALTFGSYLLGKSSETPHRTTIDRDVLTALWCNCTGRDAFVRRMGVPQIPQSDSPESQWQDDSRYFSYGLP